MNLKYASIIAGIILALMPLGVLAEELDADTFVGFGTEITISGLDDLNGSYVTFVVYVPDDSVVEKDVKVRRGRARLELGANDTSIPGIYDVDLESDNGKVITSGSFEVFKDVPADLVKQLLEDSVSSSGKTGDSRRRPSLGASLLDEYKNVAPDDAQNSRTGFIDHFAIELRNRVVRVNEQIDLNIEAQDRRNRLVDDYVGGIVVETTDPDAQVPEGIVKFFASDRGVVNLPLSIMFGTPGAQTIYVHDADDDSISGDLDVRVVGKSGSVERGGIIIESPSDGAIVGNSFSVNGSAPAYINLELVKVDSENGTEAIIATGESDGDGNFSFVVTPDTNYGKYELVVREGQGGLDRKSDSINVSIDAIAPKISDITLLPDTILPGASFIVNAFSENDSSLELGIGGAKTTMSAVGVTEDGLQEFTATATAPREVGDYTVEVHARDSAGNESVRLATLSVHSSGLPVVRGVEADVNQKDILLRWQPVPGAYGYRIYFGADPYNLDSSIDTGSSASSARLTGVKGGRVYYLAVSAVNAAGIESVQKSEIVSAAPKESLFNVEIIPEVNGARVQWKHAPGVDAKNYHIRYGVQPGAYTERRIVSGGSTSYDLVDLVNGVTYYVLLSAVDGMGNVTDDILESIVVPGANATAKFNITIVDSPLDFIGGAAGNAKSAQAGGSRAHGGIHGVAGVTKIPSSGLSSSLWMGIAFLLPVIIFVFHIRRKRYNRLITLIAERYR